MHVLARYSVGVQCVFPGSECRVNVVLLHCVCDGRASCYRTIRYIEPIKDGPHSWDFRAYVRKYFQVWYSCSNIRGLFQ